MLKMIHNMKEISFPALMEVYGETNGKTGREEWPDLPEGFALQQAEQDFYQYLRDVFFKTEGAFYALWEAEGKVVSALRAEPYRDGLLLEALETHPSERRKGYGRALLQGVVAHTAGIKLYSHIEKRNEASMQLHTSCGFVKAEDFAVYIDGSVNYRGSTYCYRG